MPKRVKYRKTQKGKSRGVATTGAQMHFGEFGLKAIENGFIPARQLEAPVSWWPVNCAVPENYGSTPSRISPSPKNPRKPVWVKVRVIWTIG